MNYYEILGVDPQCDFATMKKAYYKRAKECHPDRFANAPGKVEEFKQLVEAFVLLSDPEKRRHYDATLNSSMLYSVIENIEKVMDSDADDTLEELIVGNTPPPGTTIFTFFRDLEKTLIFMTSREAKDLFYKKKFRSAAKLYKQLVSMAPANILYRVYYARSLTRLHKYKDAAFHYRAAIALGKHREPVQHLLQVKFELKQLNKKRLSLLHKLLRIFQEKEQPRFISPEEEMIAVAEKEMSRMLRQHALNGTKSDKKLLGR